MSQSAENNATHDCYTDADDNVPSSIKDCYGSVALALCKVCGAGECELDERPCTTPKARVEAQPISSPPRSGRALRPNTQLAAENRAAMNETLADFIEVNSGSRPATNSTTEQLVRQVSALGARISCSISS